MEGEAVVSDAVSLCAANRMADTRLVTVFPKHLPLILDLYQVANLCRLTTRLQ